MKGHCADDASSVHHSRHYESCLNSTCSRSPTPVRRQLWEPKHPPPQKFKDGNKKSPLRFLATTKSHSHAKDRDKSPFIHRHHDCATPNGSRGNRDPLFTYTVNEGLVNTKNGTKNIKVTIQEHPRSSSSSSRNKTPEPRSPCRDPNSSRAGNLTLELDLNIPKVPPIEDVNNCQKKIAPVPKIQNEEKIVPYIPSLTTICKLFPCPSSPRAVAALNSICAGCICPYPTSSLSQSIESCDPCCQVKPCPCLTPPKSKEDKSTSPIKPCSTPQELDSFDSKGVPIENCSCLSSPRNKEDKATTPTKPQSRSTSPTTSVTIDHKPTPLHSRNSSINSDGTIEIKTNTGQVKVDWEGDVGPIQVEVPVSHNQNNCQSSSAEDRIHSYDPQLEAFYTSSCNRSQTPSPTKSRSFSPSTLSERLSYESRRPRPPWNPCLHIDSCCPSEKHSTSSSPWRSKTQSTRCQSFTRSAQSRTPSTKGLSRNNSLGSFEIDNNNGKIEAQLNLGCPKLDVDTQCTCGGFQRSRSGCNIEGHLSYSPDQSTYTSPRVTLTPCNGGSGQVTVEWNNSASNYDTEYEELDPLSLYRQPHDEDRYEDYPSSYCQDEEELEEKYEDFNCPSINMQVCTHPTLTTTTEISTTCKGSKSEPYVTPYTQPCDSFCTPCSSSPCTPPCGLRPCTPPCVPTFSCGPCNGPLDCCENCCCYNKGCMIKPTEGINKCPILPPHLQSDWSASLRSPNMPKTKPILYLDPQGHEHIMFADGSIEHLTHHCKPTPHPPVPQSLPKSPISTKSSTNPKACKYLFQHDENFDQYCTHFSPQSGDIVICAHQRIPCTYRGKDDGQVAFFSSDYNNIEQGDTIVRLGKFDQSGRWCPSEYVEMYMCGARGRWIFLGTHKGHECLHPLEANQNQIVRTPNKQFKPKLGDLVINTTPGPNSFYFWNPRMKLDCDHSHLLLRTYIGRPQVVDRNHNLACCVDGHLPVGYAELYVKVNRIWLFLGRDDHMFTEHELLHLS